MYADGSWFLEVFTTNFKRHSYVFNILSNSANVNLAKFL